MGFDTREHAKLYTPQEGDTLNAIAERETAAGNPITWQELARFNWGTDDEVEVNAFLRDELGCRERDAANNFIISSADEPHGELLIPVRFTLRNLALEKNYTLRVRRKVAPPQFLECCHLPGVTFAFSSSFIRPGVVGYLKKLEAVAGRHSEAKIMIFGHTDAVDDDLYNKKLSERRAWSVYAFITNDPDAWEVLYNHPDEAWGLAVIQEILADLGHDPGAPDGDWGPHTRAAMRSFLGLPEDASVQNDAAFRKQLFAAYMASKHDINLPPERFMDPSYMGCGEFNPAVETEGAAEQNRRVTFFFFHPDRLPTLPCAFADVAPCQKQIYAAGPRFKESFRCSHYDSLARSCSGAEPSTTSFRVHADFDHDGVISRKLEEQALSQQHPGLIIIANIDADGESLPKAVANRPPVELDYQKPKSGSDTELGKLIVEITNPAATSLAFHFAGPSETRYILLDKTQTELPRTDGRYEFSVPGSGTYVFFIESRSLPGTPLVADAPAHIALNIDLLDAARGNLDQEQVIVTTAPLILIDNVQPAERVYMCEIPEKDERDRGNLPSVVEVSEIVGKMKDVQFALIPAEVNSRDAWAQDQFQLGYCQSAAGSIRVVLHLPRLRSNVVQTAFGSNLATFVPGHFPSKDLGVFEDFYDREIGSFTDEHGNVQQITFMKSFEPLLLFNRVMDVWKTIRALYPLYRTNDTRDSALEKLLLEQPMMTFFMSRRWLKTAVGITKKLLTVRSSAPHRSTDEKQRLAKEMKNLVTRFEHVKKTILLSPEDNPERLKVSTDTFGEIRFTKQQADDFYNLAATQHSSINYGGNLEVSGPVSDAPFGKVVLGTHADADPDLLTFLKGQLSVQPLVDIDTSWLHVAHVDEVMAFLPAPKSNKPFMIAIASPRIAMQIIVAAWETHLEAGGEAAISGQDHEKLPINIRDITNTGDAPITRLLRGRYWLHSNPPDAFEELPPPQIYKDLFDHYYGKINPYSWIGTVEYDPEPGPDRYYDAAMTIREFLAIGRFTNWWLGDHQQLILQEQLVKEFPDTPQIPIPVLYDEVPWYEDTTSGEAVPDFELHKTSAFLPNGVNMQVINAHLLIPRPFGPRASPEVAAQILRKVMEDRFHDVLTPDYFASKKLDRLYHWIKRPLRRGSDWSDLNRLAREFKDGFVGLEEAEISKQIYEANKESFGTDPNPSDGGLNLKEGWHKLLIPENTVDLFEAYIQARLETSGLIVHFADSWYYHTHMGELHCGTNVLRQTPTTVDKWWDHALFVEE